MNFSDINSLELSNLGNWPLPAKVGAIVLLCGVILGAGYWFDTKDQWQRLKDAEAQEQGLKNSYASKQAQAANLQAYKVQLKEMHQTFGAMLRQLPSKAEVADLLVDISQTGLASGLQFELFSPKAETPKEFYAELPIMMKVTGDFHQLANFVSGLAALPRIVTLHDSAIVQQDKDPRLAMEVTAKTYRYLDEPIIAAETDPALEVAK